MITPDVRIAMAELSDQALPRRLTQALEGSYTIEGEIGRGGMGVVYRARDERLQRRVAIKVLPPELAFQKDIRERFTREAQTAARLSHPHIVPIHTVGEGADGLVYFVMGYVDGEPLGHRLRRRGKLPHEEVRRIMKETADALSAAHALSVIHRDIKPDNILLEGTRGRVMVTDFGIAKALSNTSHATLTGAGIAIGTPSYMSPEQAAGEREIDGRSDIYSLGIVSYQMLVGELPFQAPTVAGILMKQITEPAPDVLALRPDAPQDLALAVARCLEKDPENRWPTADALRRALESRSVGGYRPTGTGWRSAGARSAPPRVSERARERPGLPARRLSTRPSRHGGGRRLAERPRRSWEVDEDDKNRPPVDTGEPAIIQETRAYFARWAAISGGCFLINVATGLDAPWFLFVAGGMGIGLLRRYATLWQMGYSWRDVLSRPPAPDAIEARMGKGGKLPRKLPAPKAEDFGTYLSQVHQAQKDRAAILSLYERLPAEEKKMLPEIVGTVDGLFQRANDLARTLHAMDSNMDTLGIARIEERIEALQREPDDEERARRLGLLERQKRQMEELRSRRDQVAANLESCLLAMQNVRYDLLRLKSAGIAAVLGDLTNATQQARALSRDVDHAIAAASEVRDAIH